MLETSTFRCNDRMNVLAFLVSVLETNECKNAAKKKTHRYDHCFSWLALALALGDLKITKKMGGLKKGTLHKTSPYLGLYPFRVTVANKGIQY